MNVTLKKATLNDAGRLHDWRNDPETIAASINSEPVKWSDHLVWVSKTIDNPDKELLVGWDGPMRVGVVRLDKAGDRTELSWTVNPYFRRRGYGVALVSTAANGRKSLFARIKKENIASQKIAERAGFTLAKDGPLQEWARS